jgi:dTDP-4-dehydrorhamnose reductase
MRILVTGAMGRLGGRLVEILTPRHEAVQGVGRSELDFTDFAAARAYTAAFKPDIVLHPAAWTDVDGCAREPERAIAINGLGAQNMALAAAQVGASFLYVSSNEVFDGKNTRPYTEYDVTNPINPYGYSKWVGEQAISRANPRHYIVRTAWLFAHGGKNFIQAILNGAKAGKSLRVVVNEIANPTYNDDLADAIAQLIETERYGIYHFVNEGACSRYAFARYVLDQTGFADTPITPISASEWPRPSTPPVYSSLNNLAGRAVGITLRPWQAAVDAFLAKEGLKV